MSKRITHMGKCIINDLAYDECINCTIGDNAFANKDCPKEHITKRISYDAFGDYTLFICDSLCKTRKLFDEYRYALKDSTKALVKIAEESGRATNKAYERGFKSFTHNTKSIVAHAIQDLDKIINQNQSVTTSVQKNIERVTNKVQVSPEETALICLRLSKHLLGLKAEYQSFDLIRNGGTLPQLTDTNVRNVIMTVIHMFYSEFKLKNIYISVEEWRQKSKIDYMTIQMAVYYIIENALKYARNNSQINIKFKIEKGTLVISFNMLSLFIEPGEEKRIFEEGYSGKHAIDTNKKGSGIGMYNAYQLIELNSGSLEVEAGEIKMYDEGIPYADNSFIIKLPHVCN